MTSNKYLLSPIHLVAIIAWLLLAASPLQAEAVVTEYLKLVPNDSIVDDAFGQSVAVSGSFAVVGAPRSGVGGAVYVFDTATGQQLRKLVPTDLLEPGAKFGDSISVDGDLVVVGAYAQDIGGAAYVFDLASGNQVAKLVSTDISANDGFGRSVAIHGNTALIGAPYDDDVFNAAGAAYLFDISLESQSMKYTADSPGESSNLGQAVAFDGVRVVAMMEDPALPTIDFLLFNPLTGDQLALVQDPYASTRIGEIAISGDRILMGTPSPFPNGAAELHDISDINNVITSLVGWPGDPLEGWYFGEAVALTETAAVISTAFSGGDLGASGIVHLFDPDTEELLESFRSSDAIEDDFFGKSVGLDGQTLIVGASGDTTIPGAAYLFTIPEPSTLVLLLFAGPAVLRRRRGVAPWPGSE